MKRINRLFLCMSISLLFAGCNNNKCSFTFEGSNCFMEHEDSYEKGTELTLKIATYLDYVLPKNITVEGSNDFTYIRETGEFKVTINENIKIICDAIPLSETYSFSFQGTNCTANQLRGYPKNEEVEILIKADDTYDLPYKINCSGFEDYSYNKKLGTFKGKIVSNASLMITAYKSPEYQYVYKQIEYSSTREAERTITYEESFIEGKKQIYKTSVYSNHSYINYNKYQYDTSDRLIKVENGQIDGGDTLVYDTSEYFYEDGKLKEIATLFYDGTVKTYKYSYHDLPNGYYQEEEVYHDGSLFLTNKTETIIDQEHNRKTEIEYQKDPGQEYRNFVSRLTYALDTGKLLETFYNDPEHPTYTYKYNDNGDILTEEKTDDDGKISLLENHFNNDGTISYQTRKSFDGNEYVLNKTYNFILNDSGFIESVEYLNASNEYTGGLSFEYGLNEVPFKGSEEQRPLGVGNYNGCHWLML